MALLLFSLSSSCDPGSTIKYEIVNNTATSIKATYEFVFEASGDTSAKEMTIPANSSKVIGEHKPLGYVTQYDQEHDSIFLYWLTLQQEDKATSHNFKDKKYWTLEKKDELNATYRLIVDSALFAKE